MQSEEQELGHYQFRRLLGEGGFGEVYEAWDSKLHRSIAIKRLKPKMLSARPDTLLDEARLAASLRHPAFVKIFSIDGDADQQSIIMEYVDGNTLRKMGEGEPLSETLALDIVDQVAEAMEEAHASQLIHGDLKPSNLMLEASGTVRIMDFGLARRIDPQSTESVVLDDAQGTIAYLAPELLTGTRPNEQSDVYSLGVVLYEMVTGGRPFPHLNGLALAAAYMQSSSAAWPYPAELNPAIGALIRAMTDRNLNERIRTMRAVHDRIAAIKSGAAVPVPVVPVVTAPPHAAPSNGGFGAMLRKYRVGIGAGAAVLLAVAVGIGTVQSGLLSMPVPRMSDSAMMREGLDSLKTYDREDRIDFAIQTFTALLANNPKHAGAAAGLSRAYALRYIGDKTDPSWLQRADASAQLALQLDDQLALAHSAMAAVRISQNRKEEALRYAEQALRLDPGDTTAPLVKTRLLVAERKFKEAEAVIQTGIATHPKEHRFLDELGVVRYAQGDYAGAEAAFRRSIALEPDSAISYSNLSTALQFQNRETEALQVLQQGLQVRPVDRLYQALGSVLFSRGDYVESAKAFEKAVQGGGARNYLNWANLADTLRWLPGRERDAISAYKQAVAILRPLSQRLPKDSTINSRLGLYLARMGEHAEALRLHGAAIAAAPDSGAVRFRAAVAYELSGNRDSAFAELENAIQRKYPPNLIRSEPDLIALRRDPRYRPLLPESSQ